MLKHFASRAARLLAMLAVSLQVMLPGVISVAQANGIDLAQYICLTPGEEPNAEAKAAALRIAEIVGDTPSKDPVVDTPCPLCTLAHGAPLPNPVLVASPPSFSIVADFVLYEPGLLILAQGPPLGSRGPPTHL